METNPITWLLGLFAAAAAASLGAGIVLLLSQGWHGKHSLDHDTEGVQKFHTVAVPRIGGLGVVFGLVAGLLFAGRGAAGMPHGAAAFTLLLASVPTFCAGIIEDLTKKISARTRLFASIASALAASWLLGATVDKLDIWGVDALLAWAPLALLVTAVVVAGGVNAINIIDGFNGLSSATVILMLSALAAIGWQSGDQFVVELAVVGIGAAFGFLALNFPTGRIFLGDGGAYLLGFWVAEVAVLLLVRNDSVNAWRVLSVCAYPVIEVGFSIYRRRFVRNANPGDPDCLHLHTLVYRRLVWRLVAKDAVRPWVRNAAVSCLIIPWVALVLVATVAAGDSTLANVLLVCAQVVGYIAVYARLVRGQWRSRPAAAQRPAPARQGAAVHDLQAARGAKPALKPVKGNDYPAAAYLAEDGHEENFRRVS